MTDFLTKEEVFELNHIIAELYGNYNKESALETFLRNLQSIVFFEKGDIYIFEKKDNHINIKNFISFGYGAEVNSYIDHYCDLDDVLPLISVKQPIMFRSSDIFLMSERVKTDYYKNHLEPSKMHYSIEGNIYTDDGGTIVGMGIHRSREYEDFTQKELDIVKLMRPHLSRVSQELCDVDLVDNNIFKTSQVFSGTDKLGIIVWDWSLDVIEEDIGDNDFIVSHREDLRNVIKMLCKNLKNNIELDDSSKKIYGMKSKIIVSEKSYYVDIAYDIEKNIFVTYLYDYTGIIESIMLDMKEKYALTEREYDVFQCMIKGMNNQEIQDALYISMPTVKKHLSNIYQKLDVEGRHQLIHSIL